MMKMLRQCACLVLALTPALQLYAREWVSTDGRKLEADFVSATTTEVTLKRSTDGQLLTFPKSRLSAADQAFIREQTAKPAKPLPITGPFASLVTGDWALSEYRGLPFALYAAKELSATDKVPLILALHGRTDDTTNGQQVKGWMKTFTTTERFKKHPCIIVAPFGYQPYGGSGTAWSDKPGAQTITLMKEMIKSLPVDLARVYCIGYSMGGYGACHLINQETRMFAAGVAVAGCSGPQTASTFKTVPLWLFHAADDATVPVQTSRDLARALERAKDCRYTEYPTGGHGVVNKAFEEPDLHEWLFSQTKAK